MLRASFLIIMYLTVGRVNAQTIVQQGWLFWSHEQELTKKIKLFSDIQLRTSDDGEYIETLLIRPGITYLLKSENKITAGYTLFANWEMVNEEKIYQAEHRIWEQYLIESDLEKILLTNRLRLEQRFLGQQKFAQRLRYYIRMQLPLFGNSNFTSGYYFALQNELFLNVQNKQYVNDQAFDQNRVYSGIGYKFNKNFETELGYMFRYQIESENNLRSHVIQLTISSSF